MRVIEMFVRRPVIAIVVNLALVLIGLRAVTQLPIQQYPRIESSSIVITTVYVGASAESIRGFVTTPIERAVSSITGIDYVESSSVAGLSTVTARLKLNHPSTVALAEVGNRMDQIRSGLANSDLQETERGAHSLKSSAANIGAETLRTMATRMESAALDDSVDDARALLPTLEDAYESAMTELSIIEKGLPE